MVLCRNSEYPKLYTSPLQEEEKEEESSLTLSDRESWQKVQKVEKCTKSLVSTSLDSSTELHCTEGPRGFGEVWGFNEPTNPTRWVSRITNWKTEPRKPQIPDTAVSGWRLMMTLMSCRWWCSAVDWRGEDNCGGLCEIFLPSSRRAHFTTLRQLQQGKTGVVGTQSATVYSEEPAGLETIKSNQNTRSNILTFKHSNRQTCGLCTWRSLSFSSSLLPQWSRTTGK